MFKFFIRLNVSQFLECLRTNNDVRSIFQLKIRDYLWIRRIMTSWFVRKIISKKILIENRPNYFHQGFLFSVIVHRHKIFIIRINFLSILNLSQVGGNNMFKMLWDTNFTYDSSMPIYENRPPSWPYTLDYKLFHDCMIPPCPTRSYPGLWEVPMVMWQDLNGGRCSMGDACSNPPTADGVYKMLIKNFERHYTTNR